MSEPRTEYRTIVQDSGDPGYVNRILIGTPVTGLVRIEWVQARYGQIVPVNWSQVQMLHYMSSYFPLRYQVADAQNIIVKEAVEKDFQWLLLWEHDTIPPADALVRLNEYMRRADTPVVSGLYYTRSYPSEPLIFRGRGTGAFYDWQPGDLVWCDGVPTGFLLVHMGLIRAMWEDSEEYQAGNVRTRRVFRAPHSQWMDPQTGQYNITTGTSDLDWCTRVMQGGYLAKAGWPEYQERQYPFVVDTHLFCRHCNPDGRMFP